MYVHVGLQVKSVIDVVTIFLYIITLLVSLLLYKVKKINLLLIIIIKKTHHDITEILLKMTLNTTSLTPMIKKQIYVATCTCCDVHVHLCKCRHIPYIKTRFEKFTDEGLWLKCKI